MNKSQLGKKSLALLCSLGLFGLFDAREVLSYKSGVFLAQGESYKIQGRCGDYSFDFNNIEKNYTYKEQLSNISLNLVSDSSPLSILIREGESKIISLPTNDYPYRSIRFHLNDVMFPDKENAHGYVFVEFSEICN